MTLSSLATTSKHSATVSMGSQSPFRHRAGMSHPIRRALPRYITKDPDTGIQNLGTYRGQVKAPLRLGLNPSIAARAGSYTHWTKYKARGERMPAAVVLSGPPCVAFTAAQKVPENIDELAVAGGLVGAPVNVVRAKTVDLLVPAEAEIIVEGYVITADLEPEAPFGESHGHMNLQEYNAYMEVTCITRRKNAILTSIISQVTPSESSVIKRVALEPLFTQHLREVLGIRAVVRVSMHEPLTNLRPFIIITMAAGASETEVWRALLGATALHAIAGKYVIAVDDDIDPRNSDMILWALAYRANPTLDFQIIDHKQQGHGPKSKRNGGQDSIVLVNAMLGKEHFPADLSSQARVHGTREGAYGGGAWPSTLAAGAALVRLIRSISGSGRKISMSPQKRATEGDYFTYGESLVARRRSDVSMNTEVRTLNDLER